MLERKQDTRSKIELGGLIVKAGLRDIDKAVLLGALLEVATSLDNPAARERWRSAGQRAFDQTEPPSNPHTP